MKPKAPVAKQQKIPEVGVYNARLYKVVVLGTQTPKDPKYKPSFKVKLDFELVDTNEVFDEAKGPQPFSMSLQETFSFHEKSNFRKHIESWIGVALTEAAMASFDLKQYVGKAVQVVCQHKNGTKDPSIIYANIANLLPAKRDANKKIIPIAKGRNPQIVFDMESLDSSLVNGKPTNTLEVFKLLNKWEQEMIESSPEWKQLTSGIAVLANNDAEEEIAEQELSEDEPPY